MSETGTITPIEEEKPAKGSKMRIAFLVLLVIVLVGGAAFGIYVSVYYHPDNVAVQAAEDTGPYAEDAVQVEHFDGKIAFIPQDAKAGFIFYPGGKVQAEAYAPLMQDLAARGILCVICPMPFNLAVFNINAADGITDHFSLPEEAKWYIGGHSLGGSMAAQHFSDLLHKDGGETHFAGIVLLGSYSTSDLSSHADVRALLIRGTEDKVLNSEAYANNSKNLPPDTEEIIIDGGNHSQFGSYGKQDGDGEAGIEAKEQWEATADSMAKWMQTEAN